ncbi:MAG: rhodanese-like domain-containing protein [Pseudomonadota bacterium]
MNHCRLNSIAAVIVMAMMLTVATAHAAQTETPDPKADAGENWQFHTIVDVDFVQAHQAVPMPDDVLLIDSRPYKPKYVEGHIPGAISIPDTQFEKSIDRLPKDKSTLLIFYCGGLDCRLSHKSAKKAEALGYTNVKVFAKGYPEWIKTPGEYGAVSAEHVAQAIANNDTLIVDARPQKPKFEQGHIPTAINIPETYFDKFSGKLPRDLATPIIFYCGGLDCKLSHKSAKAAMKLGYTRVTVFEEGYPKWKKEYGGAEQKIAVKAGEVEGSMDTAMFLNLLKANPDAMMIIDVRDADEFAKGSFKTAVNIPVDKLEDKIKGLPDNKPVVFVCSTGARSGESYYMVKDVRPALTQVYYLEAGCTFNSDGTFQIKKSEG